MLNVRVKKALLTILTTCLTVLMAVCAILGLSPAPQTHTAHAAESAPTVNGGHFEKVTSTPSDWSGYYLIVYESGKLAFDGSRTTELAIHLMGRILNAILPQLQMLISPLMQVVI